jgi:hypothetical protein
LSSAKEVGRYAAVGRHTQWLTGIVRETMIYTDIINMLFAQLFSLLFDILRSLLGMGGATPV